MLKVEPADGPAGPVRLFEGPVNARLQAAFPALPHRLSQNVWISVTVTDPAVYGPIIQDATLVENAVIVVGFRQAPISHIRAAAVPPENRGSAHFLNVV